MGLGSENAKANSKTGSGKDITLTLTSFPKTAVNVKTQEEYDQLMRIYEAGGWTWNSGDKPTDFNQYWKYNWSNTCLWANESFGYGSVRSRRELRWKVIRFEEFLKLQGLTKADIPA